MEVRHIDRVYTGNFEHILKVLAGEPVGLEDVNIADVLIAVGKKIMSSTVDIGRYELCLDGLDAQLDIVSIHDGVETVSLSSLGNSHIFSHFATGNKGPVSYGYIAKFVAGLSKNALYDLNDRIPFIRLLSILTLICAQVIPEFNCAKPLFEFAKQDGACIVGVTVESKLVAIYHLFTIA